MTEPIAHRLKIDAVSRTCVATVEWSLNGRLPPTMHELSQLAFGLIAAIRLVKGLRTIIYTEHVDV
jgi:hypothetical protein